MTRDELIKMYTDGKRDFSYADLSCADFRGAYLRSADLSYASLSFTNLSNADLSGADFRGADLRGADLSYASLLGASLSNANFWGAKYKDVVIKHVRVFSALYKYQVWAIIAEDDSEWIRLGCFFRKREEWNENFWNNDEEFPNDNSEASNMRLAAFNFACKWIDERKKAQTKEKTK